MPFKYRPDIDGLRAIAVLAVVAFHAFPTAAPAGFLGVDVFFVISGFLITGILIDSINDTGRLDLWGFYRRRIRRIFPALIVVLSSCLVAGFALLWPVDFRELGHETLAGALFYANIQFWLDTGYFDQAAATKPLLHLWSLGVEEQFYLVWPPALWAFRGGREGRTLIIVAIGAVSFLIAASLTDDHPAAAFYLPIPRFWELMAGAALATTTRGLSGSASTIASILGLGLLVVGLVGFGVNAETTWWRLVPVAGASLMIAAGPTNGVNRSILGNPVMVSMGKISYPLYLWHWPLLVFLRLRDHDTPGARLLAVVVSLGLAIATYVLIERPTQRLEKRIPWVLAPLCGALALVAIAGQMDFERAGLPMRFPAAVQPYLDNQFHWSIDARSGLCWRTDGIDPVQFPMVCTPQSTKERRTIWIWGDSYAARLYPGLVEVEGGAASIGQVTRNSCPPLLEFGSDFCKENNRAVIDLLKKSKPDLLILYANWSSYSIDYTDSSTAPNLSATLDQIQQTGVANVLLIGPGPKWKEALPKVLAEQWRETGSVPKRTTALLDPAAFLADQQIQAFVARRPLRYVSLIKDLCTVDGCLTIVAPGPDGVLTPDFGHFTTPGAVYVAKLLNIDRP